ncbi:MAG: hypothetical protein ACLSDO_03020 [Anaerotruncus colihominis]
MREVFAQGTRDVCAYGQGESYDLDWQRSLSSGIGAGRPFITWRLQSIQ